MKCLKSKLGRRFTIAFLFAALPFNLKAESASFLPLPISVEGTPQISQIYLELHSAGVPKKFTSITDASSKDGFIKTETGYLMTGDYTDYSGALFSSSPQDQFNLFSGAYQRLAPDTISARYQWGGLEYDVLQASSNPSAMVPFLLAQKGATYTSAFSLMLDPLVQNLSAFAQASVQHSDQCGPKDSADSDYSVSFASPVPSRNGDEAVVLFSGQEVDANVRRSNKDKWDRDDRKTGKFKNLVDFYEDSILKLINGDKNGYLADFTPKSQVRLSRMLSSMTADQFNRYVLTMKGASHRVRFVLDAGKVKFLFYRSVKGAAPSFDEVLETNGHFQRANQGFQGSIETLIQSQPFQDKLDQIVP